MTFRLAVLIAAAMASLPMIACGAESPARDGAAASPATQPIAPDSLFDPARHMLVSEVRPGMIGYGLTVFKGTKIEKFDVKVLSVLHNFNPQHDVVLIECDNDYLRHTGSVAGMSGSPIYLKDDQGRYRMIGAFAYGWPFTKDPIAGVQPIQYMVQLPVGRNWAARADGKPSTQPSGGGDGSAEPARTGTHSGLSWSLSTAGLVPFWRPMSVGNPAERRTGLDAGTRLGAEAPELQPLTTPLMTGGLSPTVIKALAPLFARYGLTAVEAGSGGSPSGNEPAAKLEPGAALAVPLLTGDADMTAIGTVTDVIGDHLFGFGHPFNNEGPVHLPMGSGAINGIVANLQTSFKLGALTQDRGELTTDESVGVAGQTGLAAPLIPVEFDVTYADGSTRAYHFKAAQHPKFTPLLAGVALSSAITGENELPQYNTVGYTITLQFANGRSIDIANKTANTNAQSLFSEIGLPLQAALENPFERVPVRKITGSIRISDTARLAQILDVNVPRSKYRAGETVKAFVTYEPFREPQGVLPIEMELPRDLPQGTYQLIISDAQRYFQDTQQAEPFRFTADSIRDVFGVLKDVAAIRENAVYVRLLRQPDGVAVGRVALPELPSSRRQILLGAGRSNITPFVSSTVKVIPTDMVMSGSAEFALTIDPKAKVEVAGNPKPGGKPEPAAAPLPAGKHADRHKAATAEPENPPAQEQQPKDKKED